MASTARTFNLGERVYLQGQPRRLATVVDWPPDAPVDLQKMQATYVAVRLEGQVGLGGETHQYWPRALVWRESDPEPAKPKVRRYTGQG